MGPLAPDRRSSGFTSASMGAPYTRRMSDAVAMGRTIREARLAKGMSLGQLASAVGRSSSSVRRWERGEVPPAIGIIDDLADVLDLDAAELRALRPGARDAVQPEPLPGLEERTPAGPAASSEPEVIDLDRVPIIRPPETPPDSERQLRPPGFVSDVVEVVRRATESWAGWIRGALTAGVLLVMAIVLVWAMAELFQALGEVWDSFDAGG